MSVLKRSLVLLYTFKQYYSVIRAHFLILRCLLLLLLLLLFCVCVLQNQYTTAEYNGAVDVIRKTFR